jgi:hypothetical protein
VVICCLAQSTEFVTKDPSTNTGLYEHPIIQCVINTFLFANSVAAGVRFYIDAFNPIRIKTLAFVLTAVSRWLAFRNRVDILIVTIQIECCIDEWATGIRTDIFFTITGYIDKFRKHVKGISSYGQRSSETTGVDVCRQLRERLATEALYVLQVQPSTESYSRPYSASSGAELRGDDDEPDLGDDDLDAAIASVFARADLNASAPVEPIPAAGPAPVPEVVMADPSAGADDDGEAVERQADDDDDLYYADAPVAPAH